MSVVYGKETPKLGFGLMRLPKRGVVIDVEQVKTMADLFLEAGFTYSLCLSGFGARDSKGPGGTASPRLVHACYKAERYGRADRESRKEAVCLQSGTDRSRVF